MLRGLRLACSIAVLLGALASEASAATHDFSVSPDPPIVDAVTTFSLEGSTNEVERVRWDLDGDGEFGDGRSEIVTWIYPTPGPVTVSVRIMEDDRRTPITVTKTVVVEEGRPSASFTYAPVGPQTGDVVRFSSTSTASTGSIIRHEWDLDGDGEFDDADGAEAAWAYGTAGSQLVTLRVTQTNGMQSVAFAYVEVAQRPPPMVDPGSSAPGTGSSAPTAPTGGTALVQRPATARPLAMMRPFPVVRIAGLVLPRGARVRILSVRAPRGAHTVVRCRGMGCPTGAVVRTSTKRVIRFRAFERKLRAGIRLEVFVRKAAAIGKYTRFGIRAGRPPARVDRCLLPGRVRPVRCP